MFFVSFMGNIIPKQGIMMLSQPFSFDHTGRELFEYPDPSVPFVVWTGDFHTLLDRTIVCHWHNEFEYGMLLRGELDYYIDGRHIRLRQGDVIFINANALHMATQVGNDHAVMFTVSFLPSLFTGGNDGTIFRKYFQPILLSSIRGFSIEQKTRENSHIAALLKEIYHWDHEQTDDYELLCISLICRVWSFTLGYIREHKPEFILLHKNHSNVKAKNVLTYIHEHYAEEIGIEDIARHTCISRSECFRCFQRYTNKSPIEYLTEYRLAHAMNLLQETDKSMKQIALECGFSNSNYFGKIFKKKYAIAPSRFKCTSAAVVAKKI